MILMNKSNPKRNLKINEADFDEDGLISIEDFEEIEAQNWTKFKAGLEKSRQNFQEQLNNLIARYRKLTKISSKLWKKCLLLRTLVLIPL